MKLFEIEKIFLNKYSKLDIKEQKEYLIKEVKRIIDNNLNKEELLKIMEVKNEKN